MATSRPSIAIVGGGIGGLFAANALIAHGLHVKVYEQAAALGEIGAGVFITPNSVRQLQRVGLAAAVEKWGARVGAGSHYFRDDGSPIAPVQVTDSAGWNATFGMHRADLVNLLAAALPDGVVKTGHRATGFSQDANAARVTFENGAETEADIVVGCDGIHSEMRPHVFPPSTPVFSGTVAYRGLVPHASVSDWPNDAWQMWLGRGKHFLVFPVRAGELINFVGFVPADAQMTESWTAKGDPDALRAEFSGWDPRIEGLLRQVTATFKSALHDREPLPTWTNGRLTLLGDAAHPMLPHLGQGANPVDRGRHGARNHSLPHRPRDCAGCSRRLRATAPRTGRRCAAWRAREWLALRHDARRCCEARCRNRGACLVPQGHLRPRCGGRREGRGGGAVARGFTQSQLRHP
jgi:salicylate hydroxylase